MNHPLNRWFDVIVDDSDGICGLEAPPYLVLGSAGVAVAFTVMVSLFLAWGLPVVLAAALLMSSLTLFVVAGLVRQRLMKIEHVLLEDVLLVLTAAAAIAHLAGQPVWRTLDATAISLGAFIVFGRLGCLTGGCCHGRPCRIGVRYRDPEAVESPLLGVRLFPVQLVEAAWTLLVTLLALSVSGRGPGTALWCWLLGYSAGRFVLELARGDRRRPRLGPMTEAQWLAVGILVARIALEESARPLARVNVALAGGALLLALLGWVTRRLWLSLTPPALALDEIEPWRRLLVEEEARAAQSAAPRAQPGPGGVSLALTVRATPEGVVYGCSLSRAPLPLDPRRAYAMAGLIAQRLPPHRLLRVGFGNGAVFHFWALITQPQGPSGSTSRDPSELVRQRALWFARALRDARVEPPASAAATTDGVEAFVGAP
jgi:hypothetical protein